MDKFPWSDDVLQFMLNQINNVEYLLSWAKNQNVLSHGLVLQRIRQLNKQEVSK